MLNNIKNYHIILASKSPRRKQLLSELGLNFEVKTFDVDESYSHNMPINQVAEYLALKKALPFEKNIQPNQLVITADTVVIAHNAILGKPDSYDQAFDMIQSLSGTSHCVQTGVCILSKTNKVSFAVSTTVFFEKLSSDEISYYIKTFSPYDKAGAYGIQEWIGSIAISRIEGSYFNVMGLPVQRLYHELKRF